MKLGVTGHRPKSICGAYDPDHPLCKWVKDTLHKVVKEAVEQGYTEFHSGGALGSDTWFAEAVLAEKQKLILHVSFPSFPDLWPKRDQNKFHELCQRASKVYIVSPNPYSPEKNQLRNIHLVNHCDKMVAVFNGTKGGTANCIEYIRGVKKDIFFVDPSTQKCRWEVAKKVIDKFSGEHFFLSNFYISPIVVCGLACATVEHAYHVMKFQGKPSMQKSIAHAKTPLDAKKLGRGNSTVANWNEVRLQVMEDLLRKKFQYPELRTLLADTAEMELIFGNYWGDTYWGVSGGKGNNYLGKLLMKIRDEE